MSGLQPIDPRYTTQAAEVIALHKAGILTLKETRAIVSAWFPVIGQLAAADQTGSDKDARRIRFILIWPGLLCCR